MRVRACVHVYVCVCVCVWMDMTKLIGAFRHYTNTPKKETLISVNSKYSPNRNLKFQFSVNEMKDIILI